MTHTARKLVIAVGITACTATPSAAQDPAKRLFIGDPTLTSSTGAAAAALNLDVAKEEKRLVSKFGVDFGNVDLDLKIAGPLTKNEGSVELGDFDGLRNSTSVDIGLQYFGWNPTSNAKAARELCNELVAERTAGNLPAPNCATVTRATFPAAGSWRARYERTYDIGKLIPIVIGRLKIGQETFSFIDTTSFAESSRTEAPFSVVLGAGLYITSFGLLHASARWERAYKQPDKSTICRPLTTGQLCQDISPGGPTKSERWVLQAEYRGFFNEKYGIAVRLNYDMDEAKVAFQLPFFMRSSVERGFNTGIVFSVIPDDNKIVLSAFIGPALGITP